MVFSNLLFLYLFLPLNLLFYFFAKDIHSKNIVMIVFSLIFYAWGEPKYVFLLLGMTLWSWGAGILVQKYRNTPRAKLLLGIAVGGCLLLLGIFKYLTFLLGTTNSLFGFPKIVPQIMLPIGISFYTFQLLSYIVDVYREEVPAQQSFFRLLLYVSLFHQCIAGPIVRYKDISEEILLRKMTIGGLNRGISRFTAGLAKKAILANTCGLLADRLLLSDAITSDPAQLAENAVILAQKPVLALWLGVLMFSLQIYLDFSAYSDMAIGMGLMIGFHYKENFDYPYMSSSVSEFWRRWHISLGSFFRDYVYIPLGGNRKGSKRTILNLLIVWGLTGLWHGASWNFLLWGLYFFVFIAMEKLLLREKLENAPAAIRHLYLITVVYFGWILFRFKQFSLGGIVLKGMFGLNGNAFTNAETTTLLLNYLFFIFIAVFSVTPVMRNIGRILSHTAKNSAVMAKVFSVTQIAVPVILLLISTMTLVGNSYNPFLYFQF